jgi:hypothetical protein
MSEERKVRATSTFFGEPYPIPEPGERVVLHVADGSWREGFRCVSAPLVADGERRVWAATEGEYGTATQEVRAPAGDTWPVSQLAPSDEGY